MDKAIEYLEYLSKTGGKVGYDIVVDGEKISYNEVIAELIAHKAVLNELKEYTANKANSYNPKDSEIVEIIKCHPDNEHFYKYHYEAYTDILQKLEELTNDR